MKRVVVLGSTGSVGRQALDIARRYPQHMRIVGLAAGSKSRALAEEAGLELVAPSELLTLEPAARGRAEADADALAPVQ